MSEEPNRPLFDVTRVPAGSVVPCPLGKRCRAVRQFSLSALVHCRLEEAENCERQTEIGGLMFCKSYFYPTSRRTLGA